MLFRILTENKNREQVEELASNHFAAFTVIDAIGYWCGQREQSLIIEIDGTPEDALFVRSFAGRLARMNERDAVLIQEIYAISSFIPPKVGGFSGSDKSLEKETYA